MSWGVCFARGYPRLCDEPGSYCNADEPCPDRPIERGAVEMPDERRDPADAPAGQRPLRPCAEAHLHESGASVPGLWVEPGRDGARGYGEAYGDCTVPPPKHYQRPGDHGQDCPSALTDPDRKEVGRDLIPDCGCTESCAGKPFSCRMLFHRHEQHDGGKGPEVVRRAEWPRWPGEPGQLYRGQRGAGDAEPEERRPYGLSMALLGGGKDEKRQD